MTWYSIGLVYSKLMYLVDKEKDHDKMVDAFANSMVVITEKDYRPINKSILDIMRNNRL